MQFEVYKSKDNKLYIDYYVAVAFGVGEVTKTVTIGNRSFVEVNELELGLIEKISNETDTPYTPVYFNMLEEATTETRTVQFEVYNDNGTYYIDYYVAVAFGIGSYTEIKHIGNREFIRVDKQDIKNLIDVSKLTNTIYSPVEFKLYNHPAKKDSLEVVDFEVYRNKGKYLVDYIVAVSFGVGNPADLHRIGSRTFVEIDGNELREIEEKSNETDTPYVPHIFDAINTRHVAKLLVYCDDYGNLYISSNAADVLGLKLLCLENIKPNGLYSQITREDLDQIIESGKDKGIDIEPEYIEFKHNNKDINKNIKVINTSNRLFLPKEVCEKEALGNKDVSIKVDGNVYYETNNNELDNLPSDYKVEIDNHEDLYLDVKPKRDELVILEAFKSIETGELFLEDGVCAYCDIGNRTNATYVNDRRCYTVEEDELKKAAKILNAVAVTKYFSNEKTTVRSEKETLIIVSANSGMYLDEATCIKLSIPSNKGKVIDNKMYYRISKDSLNKLNNEYNLEYKTLPQKVSKFIVCTLGENVYVEEYLANLFKYESLGQKVRIEGKIYYQVTPEQVQKMINITANLDTKLEPEYREIKIRDNNNNKSEGRKDPKFNDDDYLDELIPGTDIYKPRYRKYDESTEDYEYFLTKYYLTFFPNAKLPSKYRLKGEEINQDTNNRVR